MARKCLYLIACILLIAPSGCQEEISMDLPGTPPRLVIEGLLTDGPEPHTVKLTTTADYFSDGQMSMAGGASVIIGDDEGNREVLTEVSEGLFRSYNLKGVPGRTYTLFVSYDGQEYEASGTLMPSPQIDSLEYRFVEETAFKEEGYYIYFYGKTDKSRINYYRWILYENDSVHNQPGDYLLANDEFVKGRINGMEFPFDFSLNDKVKIEMYTLNKDVYDYYNGLISLLYNDGGLFSPPPANPPTNIRNLTDPENPPLGYFQVSGVESKVITIENP